MIDTSKMRKDQTLAAPWSSHAHANRCPCYCWHRGERVEAKWRGGGLRWIIDFHPYGWRLYDDKLDRKMTENMHIPLVEFAAIADKIINRVEAEEALA